MRAPLRFLILAALAGLPTPGLASRAVVPDDHSTIQAAVDSGVDTVVVRQGEYPEVVQLARGVSIIGVVPTEAPFTFGVPPLPALGGLVGLDLAHGLVVLKGLRFRGVVSLSPTTASVRVSGCRLDRGISFGNANGSQDHITNCLSFGDIVNNGFNGSVGLCTVVGGTIRIPYSHSTLMVHDNVVVGPAPVGIQLHEDSYAIGNYVRGCEVGIKAACNFLASITGNIIEDCSGPGISFDHCSQSFVVDDVVGNVVRRCGGRGISVPNGYNTIAENVVENCGAEGIFHSGVGLALRDNTVLRSGATGIRAGIMIGDNTGNVVLYSDGDGIHLDDVNRLSRNIVGRNSGRGIVVDGSDGHTRSIHHNTAFANNGAGLAISAVKPRPDSLTHNISFANAIGLAWSGPGAPHLACNDWFANTGGAVTGLAPGATDVSLDPRFCDLPNDIVSLASDSPLANLAGCGQVGALGVACAVAVGVGDPRPASLGRLQIRPQPSRGAMHFVWPPTDVAITLEVFDVTGARRMARSVAPGASEFVWNGEDDSGQALPAGVYFAKLVHGRARSEATVVVIR